MHFAASIVVAAPAARIFAYLEDGQRMRQWMDGLEEAQYENPATPRGVGTRFMHRFQVRGRTREERGEIVRYAPPKAIGLRLGGDKRPLEVDYRLTERHGETVVERTIVLVLPGRLGWLFSVPGRWLMRRRQRRLLLRLKAVVEQDTRRESRA